MPGFRLCQQARFQRAAPAYVQREGVPDGVLAHRDVARGEPVEHRVVTGCHRERLALKDEDLRRVAVEVGHDAFKQPASPPREASCSTTVGRMLRLASSYAAANPPKPPPMTTTRGLSASSVKTRSLTCCPHRVSSRACGVGPGRSDGRPELSRSWTGVSCPLPGTPTPEESHCLRNQGHRQEAAFRFRAHAWRSSTTIGSRATSTSYGEKVYRSVWEPLLRGKFGPYAEEVSAMWFWNKLKLRGGSRGRAGASCSDTTAADSPGWPIGLPRRSRLVAVRSGLKRLPSLCSSAKAGCVAYGQIGATSKPMLSSG
jgi:hypothetical protein